MEWLALQGLIIISLPLIVMVLLKKSVLRASILTLAYTLTVFLLTNGINSLREALLNGLVTGLQISSIIFSTIYFYNIQRELGLENRLKLILGSSTSSNIFIAVFFSGFIESVSGYGVSSAVTAPLLLTAGLEPAVAVTGAVIGHTWAVPFASIGIPTMVLASAAGVNSEQLAKLTAILGSLSLAAIMLSLSAKYIPTGAKTLAVGLALAAFLAVSSQLVGIYSAAVFGLVGVVVGLLLSKGFKGVLETCRVLRYYLLLVSLLLIASALGFGGLRYAFLTVLVAAAITQVLEKRVAKSAVKRTVSMTANSILSVVLFAVVAELVRRGGYMRSLAELIAATTGFFYVLLVPVVGGLGAYATGSATTSNMVFSTLQKRYAEAVGLDPMKVLALQNVGGGLGGMISPAKIAVATSTVGGRDLEPEVFKEGFKVFVCAVAPQVAVALVLRLL
ncbi:MAG: L-lactate permease [Thermofilaceae archaeon]